MTVARTIPTESPTRARTAMLLAVLFGACALVVGGLRAVPSQEPEADPLARFRGVRVIVEFPDLSDVGDAVAVPAGWRHFQVTAETYDALLPHLPPGETTGLLFFDEYGNLAGREHGRDPRARIARASSKAESTIEGWRKKLARDAKDLRRARDEGKDEKELELLLGITGSGLDGYPVVLEARVRIAELEVLRTEELWQVLALEGLVRPRELQSRLSDLYDRSEGLSIAASIEAEYDRIDSGRVTHARREGDRE